MKLRHLRLIQLVGILIAVAGLLGYWLNASPAQIVLDTEEGALLNPTGELLQASFVVAGRDYLYTEEAPFIWKNGKKVRLRPAERTAYGTNTDTIFFVNVVGDQVTVVGIPRDTYLPAYGQRINAIYGAAKGDGATALREAVETLLGVPVQYEVVVSIEIFKRLIDAVGGVTVDVPYAMYHRDDAANLLIDLEPGVQRLDGELASNFVRYRGALGDDFRRIDNVKVLLAAFIDKLQQLNIRALGMVPQLIDTYFDEVEANVPPQLVAQLIPRLDTLSLNALTLPTHEQEGTTALRYDPVEVERFLATAFGGTARSLTQTPDTTLLITNRSGVPGLAQQVQRYLVELGIPKRRLAVRQTVNDPAHTRLLVSASEIAAAPFYADLFSVEWQQVYKLDVPRGSSFGLELVLGRDAAAWADRL